MIAVKAEVITPPTIASGFPVIAPAKTDPAIPAPALPIEEIVESQCKSILISCDINGIGNEKYESGYYQYIERKFSSSVPSEKEVLTALLEYLCENEKELQEVYESFIYDEEDTSDPDNKQPIAYVLMNAYLNSNVNSTGVEIMAAKFIPFNRETAEILGIDYDGVIADIKAYNAEQQSQSDR